MRANDLYSCKYEDLRAVINPLKDLYCSKHTNHVSENLEHLPSLYKLIMHIYLLMQLEYSLYRVHTQKLAVYMSEYFVAVVHTVFPFRAASPVLCSWSIAATATGI